MSALNANQLENAYAFLTHLNALAWDPLAQLMAPEFKHQYFPASMIPPGGKDTRGKEEFVDLLKYNWLTVFAKGPTVSISTMSHTFIYESVQFQTPLDVIHGVDAVVFHVGVCRGPRSRLFTAFSGQDRRNDKIWKEIQQRVYAHFPF